ncbi:hypothetical protein RhiTH_001186 [Rhizoctonia solani]|uniref:Leucine-rich repeat protein n=1 Tax=Rhizoctonia solani TaxID=456999 RepID=A0A8H7H3D8_9AGAM|nr:Leucine-rich repeat protein [Rhizoctonia solani]
MAEYLSNPHAYNYAPSSSPPSSPIPWDELSENSENECQGASPWKLESDPYSANAKATHSPLRHTKTKRKTYALPLTPASSFTSYEPSSPSPARSNISTPIRVQNRYTPSRDQAWEAALNNVFHNGATIIDLESKVTEIPREIIDLNKMVSLPLESPEVTEPPPVQPPESPSRSNIISAAARSRRVFSQSRSNNSLFSSGAPSKPKQEIQLYLANNNITILPSELFQLNNLTLLSLRGNKLRNLPPAIGHLKSLRSLNIANNELATLPSELTYLNLQTLLLDPNPFLPKPIQLSVQPIGPNDKKLARSQVARQFGPLVTHTQIPKLGELALRVALCPSPEQPPIITPLSFATHSTRLYDTLSSKSLLTPTNSRSSVFPSPSGAPFSSRSNSDLNPYNRHPFPPHALVLERYYDLSLWLSEQRDANVHIEAVRYGTDDACNLYTWCPSRKHQKDAELESETSSCGIFVQPAEERLEWVTVLAGCELSSAVPILWRGCSVGCLAFLDGSDSGLESRSLRERDEDDEFMTGFSGAPRGSLGSSEDGTPVEARAHIVWDDMMDLDG